MIEIPSQFEALRGEVWFFNLLDAELDAAEARHKNQGLKSRIVDRYMQAMRFGGRGPLSQHIEIGIGIAAVVAQTGAQVPPGDAQQYQTPLAFVQSLVAYEYGEGPRPDPIYSTVFGDSAKPFAK